MKKNIKSKNTYSLLWNQDQYKENITESWIENIKTEKSYKYVESDVENIGKGV
jgi:hypothetical protein